MILVFIGIFYIYYSHLVNTIDIIKSQYQGTTQLIEKSIYNEIKYTDIISKVAERDIQDNMENYSQIMIDLYQENPTILEWDLNAMKNQFENMDIYIINSNLEIIASTLSDEVGLDFKNYSEYGKLLKDRLEGDRFESDPINFSILEGQLKKFSYMPTPDNAYLFELGVDIKDLYPELKNLNVVYLSKDLKEEHPFVENIKVYKFNKNTKHAHELDQGSKNREKDPIPNSDQDQLVKKALEENAVQSKYIRQDKDTYHLKYIPYPVYDDNDQLVWWKSYVTEIQYNEQIIKNEIIKQQKIFARNIVIISFLYFGFSFALIYLIKKNQEMSHIDYLTKLPNRKKLEEIIENKIIAANRQGTKIAIFFFDLNDFKAINDTFGHNFGDKVLVQVAQRIKNTLRKGDMLSRLGGDEFIGLMTQITKKEEIIEIAKEMMALSKTPLVIESKEIYVHWSIGISIYPDHGQTSERLILKADQAMYHAKQNKTNYAFFDDDTALS